MKNPETKHTLYAYRARRVLTMAGEEAARGELALCRPLHWLENALLLVQDGQVLAVEPFCQAALPAGCVLQDLGEVSLIPALVNAHCHLQLAHMTGKTLWGQGFTPWLASLIALVREPLDNKAIHAGAQAMWQGGVGLLGDFVSHGMQLTALAMQEVGMEYSGFCEWFGFAAPFIDEQRPWPPRCREYMAQHKGECLTDDAHCDNHMATQNCSWQPCGHALYSTHDSVLRDAWRYCHEQGKVFSLHLAESPEETQLLTEGNGPLVDLYRSTVLPPEWRAPGLRPVALADRLGLLGTNSLVVHGVQCTAQEQRILAQSGTAVCLCPRSNENLAVGTAPVQGYIREGALLCLGTDGLSSNTDMQVLNEAIWLRDKLDISEAALLRMLTVNGAEALKRPGGRLVKGVRAHWAVLPADWA